MKHLLPPGGQVELLVGISGIDPSIVTTCLAQDDSKSWSRLLSLLEPDEQAKLLRVMKSLDTWTRSGASVRIRLPGSCGGLMHAKIYLGDNAALIGSANFTASGIDLIDQQETLIEVGGQAIGSIEDWWDAQWMQAWPISKEPRTTRNENNPSAEKDNVMTTGPQMLLGHWLGEWGAWALNGAGVVSYPHQLQAVEWIRPDGKAYLLGDEVGLGKTFTAALLWNRHRQLHGDKARLLYITKPSLIVDAISAFVKVLGVDEFLEPIKKPPVAARDLASHFTIFHAGTTCWEMLRDQQNRKRNRDYQVEGLIKEGRYRVRPESFRERIQWLSAHHAKTLHNSINSTNASSLFSKPYTFASLDTLKGDNQIRSSIFQTIAEYSLKPLVIVDESHGLGRTSQRRRAIAELIWGHADHSGKTPISRSPGSLIVFMTGTPIHPNIKETASRLGLLDMSQVGTPHPDAHYDNPSSSPMREILSSVKERAVIRRKEDVTDDGRPIFPKRLVFPFQGWPDPSPSGRTAGEDSDFDPRKSVDILQAIDQYVASEASQGAKLFSLIRRVLREAREWPEIKKLVQSSKKTDQLSKSKSSDDEAGISFGDKVLRLATKQIRMTGAEEQIRWEALKSALEAAQDYEEKLKDEKLERLTWKWVKGEGDQPEKQMFFTKAGWIATAYDSLSKGTKRGVAESSEDELPDEDEQTAGELTVRFSDVYDMRKAANEAKELARTYLDHNFVDGCQVRFSMLLALLEKKVSLRLWPKDNVQDSDRFGWGVDSSTVVEQLRREADTDLPKVPWVVHARYIHSVIDTAVRLQLRYRGSRKPVKPIVGIIIGDTPNSERDDIKERFSKGELDVVCMSDAGAEGINLQRSNRIVLLDVPVSPGRIEQIAGRIHRLGSTKAAEVTLLLPPNTLGTRVFNNLRRAARKVYQQAHGSLPDQLSPGLRMDEQLYIRKLATDEAKLLTAVVGMTGEMRVANHRDEVKRLLQPMDDGQDDAQMLKLMKDGYQISEEQKERFSDGRASNPSDLLPRIDDLVDALKFYKSATTTKSTKPFHQPVRLIEDIEGYGDLELKEEPFDLVHLDGKIHCYAARRFLPTDDKPQGVDGWLGVAGNRQITEILEAWREFDQGTMDEDLWKSKSWTTNSIPQGKAIAFCGIANVFRRDGSGAAHSEQSLHVVIGFGGLNERQFVWRPFFARGQGTAWDLVRSGTSLEGILPTLSKERWAATLIRHLTGLESGITCCPDESDIFEDCARKARGSLVVENVDQEDNTKSWRLRKSFTDWLDENRQGTWWDGGDRRDCLPRFFLLAVGQ